MKTTYHIPTTKQEQEQLIATAKRLFPGSVPEITQRAIGTLNINWNDLDTLADLLDAKIEYGPFVTFTIEAPDAGYNQEQAQFLARPDIEIHNEIDPQELLDDLNDLS